MIFTVYVLQSLKNKKRYVGFTSKSPEKRLSQHNQGSNFFTGQNRPFRLIYHEEYIDKTVAIKREKFLKSGQGRKFLDSLNLEKNNNYPHA